jgi:Matrixin
MSRITRPLLASLLCWIVFSHSAAAQSPRIRPSTVPANAVELAPDVYYMGKSFDPQSRQMVDGLAFVHRAPERKLKPNVAPARPVKACYRLIGFPGWTSAEPWSVRVPAGSPLTSATVISEIGNAITQWETAAGVNILGNHSSTGVLPSTTLDGVNAIAFGNAGGGGTVAVTYVWGSRRTPILEFDQIYGNNWDWTTGSGSSADAFDFANVATHEIGHAVGLDHPGNSCTEETMYAYVDFGETKKRTLNAGDILGVQALY